ncbi:L-seryl-tRNA(Sec) selenium transferase [Shewanella sp. UCD-KL12]|uniref:L-seryl-tRNA(Sec) selenium transferase n=1 Tax=Shewanella sp. UCD-KL12 TaxID=1917163 RepID=UPI0009703721|nr:L-seryl-tRNA(Sec) selenium transferase [Shewanella sp. UCD-KL12]
MRATQNRTQKSDQKVNHRLPQVEQLLQHSFLSSFIAKLSRPVVTEVIRDYFAQIRQTDRFKNEGVDGIDVTTDLTLALQKILLQRQTSVINATGTIIHTNLGRSPIEPSLWDAVKGVNTGYNNLELKLEDGKRGQRKGLLNTLIATLTGADAGLLVNNNACSIYLLLHELAKGKEVIVSRGEQIQIGGGFRIPDILALSGAKLVEVGTTNITTADDYIEAITENTAMVLVVHQSNFAIRGFTESADIKALSRRLPKEVILAVDQGSGVTSECHFPEEKSVGKYISAGADLVCFSGDKILGGPQAGIICGCDALIKRLEKNPMMRAFRPGRVVLSLIEELLVRKLNEQESGKGISERLISQLSMTLSKADRLTHLFPNHIEICSLKAVVGGGTLPDIDYPCWGVTLAGEPNKLSRELRLRPTPVIGVIHKEQFMLNLASVTDADFELLIIQLEEYLLLKQGFSDGHCKGEQVRTVI